MTALETDPATIERWKAARQEELDAEAIYRALAAAQTMPERAELLAGIADDERRHAEHWEELLRAAGVDPGPAGPAGARSLPARRRLRRHRGRADHA